MKPTRVLLLAVIVSSAFPALAFADDRGVIAGVEVSAGTVHGSSDTRNGGGFGGGGVVTNVDVGHATGIGAHVGYRFGTHWSAFLGYTRSRGDIRWDAEFPSSLATHFSGTAESDVLMANVSYAHPLSDATGFDISAGLGVSRNTLADVVETVRGTHDFASNVHEDRRTNPAARIAAGIRHALSPNTTLGLEASLAYVGKFRTGTTRSGNLGVTQINPYEIDGVWHASLTASLRYAF